MNNPDSSITNTSNYLSQLVRNEETVIAKLGNIYQSKKQQLQQCAYDYQIQRNRMQMNQLQNLWMQNEMDFASQCALTSIKYAAYKQQIYQIENYMKRRLLQNSQNYKNNNIGSKLWSDANNEVSLQAKCNTNANNSNANKNFGGFCNVRHFFNNINDSTILHDKEIQRKIPTK